MATLTTQQVVRTSSGITPTYASADTNGDKFSPGDNVMLHFKNTNASPRVVTIATAKKVDEFDVADMTVTVPATTGDKMAGPFPASIFAGADGLVSMTYDASTNLSVAVVKI